MSCFGGSSSAPGASSTNQQQTSSTISKSFLPIQKKTLTSALKLYSPQLGKGTPIYEGERVAPFSDTQQQALSSLPDFLKQFTSGQYDTSGIPMFNEAGETLRKTLAGETGAQEITPGETESYFQGTIKDPALKQYREETLPEVREAYAGPGFFGSARSVAQAKTGQDLFDTLNSQRSELNWNTLMANREAQEAQANRMIGAVPTALEYGQQPMNQAVTRLGATGSIFSLAGQEQTQQQAEINSAMQKFAEQNQLTNPEDLAIILALLGMNYSTSTSTGQGTSQGQTLGTPFWQTLFQ